MVVATKKPTYEELLQVDVNEFAPKPTRKELLEGDIDEFANQPMFPMTPSTVRADPNDVYIRAVETQDIATELDLPLEYSEEIADVLDGQKLESPGFLKRGFYGFIDKAIVQPFKNIIKFGGIGRLDASLEAFGEIRRIKEEEGREVDSEEFIKIMERSRAKTEKRVQVAAPALQVPPAEGVAEKGLEVATGVLAFVTKLVIARKFVGGSGAGAEIAAFEAVNIVDAGTPGMGILLASSLGLVGKIPVATTLGRAGKLAGQGGVLAGITAAKGGSSEDIAVAFLLPSMLHTLKQFPHLVRGKAFEATIAKDIQAKGYSAKDAKNIARSVRDAVEVRGGKMSPKRWGVKHGKVLDDIRAKYNKAVETITKRITPEKAGAKAKPPAIAVIPVPGKPVAPITPKKVVEVPIENDFVIFEGIQEGIPEEGIPDVRLFTLKKDIKGHPAGSTLAEETLSKAGIPLPEGLPTPEPTPTGRKPVGVAEIPPKAAEAKPEAVKIEPAPLRKPVTVSGKEFHPQTIPVESIGVDPAKFQFKLGAKLAGGVTEALRAVEKFDPIKAGTVLVWQDKSGKYWVIDGHHRVALARKTGQESLDAWVVREEDGWTAADARATGALRNLADGKGTAVDAAKLFRDTNITLEQLKKEGVPTDNTIVQQGMEMKNLSDEVFRLVIDERLPPNMAAAIGREVKGPTQQKQVSDLILEGEIETVRQAEFLAMTIDTAPVLTKQEQTLFGVETTEKSLYAERAKILASVERKLKTNRKVFGTLAKQSGLIESKGNILDRIANMETKEMAEEVLFMLDKFANAKGEVAEALNEATKEYAKYPTKDNLAKITNDLVQKWTEATTGLTIQNIKGLFGAPAKRAEPKVEKPEEPPRMKGKAGKLDVTPLQDAFTAFMNIIEPAKAVEIRLGKDVSATVIVGVHKADVARIEFNEKEIENMDRNLREFGEALSKYPKKVLENLMLSRGKPYSPEAIEIRDQALQDLAKEAPELVGTRKMISRIADFNYKYLTDVVGDEIHYVEDYFYGIYKNSDAVDRFIKYWKTTKRFTKEKKLPTVADAKAFGLDMRDPNPVNNLMSEYMAIARLDGMIEMRDELMRAGEDKYISKDPEKLADPDQIPEPVFKGLWVDKDLARMIKKLISTNKIQRYPALNALRIVNNFLRSIKFTFSMFHHLAEAKQSVADSGLLGFAYKKTATRGITFGFKKGDPIFKTEEYKDYIAHGGGHRYSIDSEAQRVFTQAIQRLTKSGQALVRGVTAPLRIPETYVRWLFESYIPKVKYSKYLDTKLEQSKKHGRELTSAEKIDIIKEQQNFYGMMNERLFGRSGTVTTLLRFKFMAPGFAEGNFRTILKSILQWGQEGTFKAERSRANIINSFIITGIAATVGTLILTGKLPDKPKEAGDIRDLFKIDTGKTDIKGRKIMIDLMSYDKDYWTIFGKPLVGQAGEVPRDVFRRFGGMTATTWEVMSDLNQMSMGKAIYDWKGNRIVEVTDPFAQRVLSLVAHEAAKVEPISFNIYGQSRERGFDRLTAAITTLLGARPTTSEKDKRESEIISRIFSLRDRQERLYYYLGSIKDPRKHIDKYNRIAQSIMDNPVTTEEMRKKWGKNIIIDTDRLTSNKVHAYELAKVTDKPDPDELKKLKKWLDNFDIPESQYRKHLVIYEIKHRKLITEMKVGDADELLKNEIAKFYADKGILDRKVKDETATDAEKRQARKYSKISSNISEIGTLIHKTEDITKRKRYFERVRTLIERSE